MNTTPPRISIEYEGVEVALEPHRADSPGARVYKHNTDSYQYSASSRSSAASSLEGPASDAFAILLLQKATSTTLLEGTALTSSSRTRSQSDSVTISPTWHTSTPPSSSCLPPEPKSFSSSCRRSVPIPAFILPCTPSKNSNSNTLDIASLSTLLATPATPLTAISLEEHSPGILTPGLIQIRRSFPLPPSSHHPSSTEDTQTPTAQCDMEAEQPQDDLFFISHRLPGAFESFESFDSVETVHEDRNSVAHPSANMRMQDPPTTPPASQLHHLRSSSCRSTSSKPSPGGGESVSSSCKRPRRAVKNKRSEASFKSTDREEANHSHNNTGEGTYDSTYGYDFISCHASPSTNYQQQRPVPAPTRSASRGSWRSRSSRPDTAMSTTTTAETVYEDAVEQFSGDEADAEEEASEVPLKSAFVSRLAVSTASSNSSISTVRGGGEGYEKPLGRFRLSFQRRRAPSPFSNAQGGRPTSSLSVQSRDSSSLPSSKRLSGSVPPPQRAFSTTPRSSPEDEDEEGQFSASPHHSHEKGEHAGRFERRSSALLASSSSLSTSTSKSRHRLSQGSAALKGHRRNNSSSTTSEDIKERSPSAMSALRPLMLTPEKTRRGSLKDWSIVPSSTTAPPHGSQFVEEAEHPSLHEQDHRHAHHIDIPAHSMQSHHHEGQSAYTDTANPYAQIYEELAKSPELESDATLSPLSPEFRESMLEAATGHLKASYTLEPVAEESFVESDREVRQADTTVIGDISNATIVQGSNITSERGQEAGNTSATSISVVALTTDTPPSTIASRQSTESRRRRSSRPPSVTTPADPPSASSRIRTSSVASSALSRPTYTSNTTNASLNSVENATVEYGQRASRQMGSTSRLETRSPRSEGGGFGRDLAGFFQLEDNEPQPFTGLGWIHHNVPDTVEGRHASVPLKQMRHSQDEGRVKYPTLEEQPTRQRTKSQPAKLHHARPVSHTPAMPQEDVERYNELINELLPLDAGLRKQFKNGNKKVAKQAPSNSFSQQDNNTHFSMFLRVALKKRKTAGPVGDRGISSSDVKGRSPCVPIKEKGISAPRQARHICTGALNPNVNRETPFGRRPSSPVRGYIDVPFAGATRSEKNQQGQDVHQSLFLDFDIRSGSNMVSPITNGSGNQSSPSHSNASETTYPSPAFFSSPLSSTSSHSEEGPSTPRALSPAIDYNTSTGGGGGGTGGPVDFWAVSFAEAQAAEGDFVAPHASLVKSNKLAMLSTNEKARRRASKASFK